MREKEAELQGIIEHRLQVNVEYYTKRRTETESDGDRRRERERLKEKS